MAVRAVVVRAVVANLAQKLARHRLDGDMLDQFYKGKRIFEDFCKYDELDTKAQTLQTLIEKIEGRHIDRSSTRKGLKNQGLEMIIKKMQRDNTKEGTRDI